MKIKEGTPVRLKANIKEGWPRQTGYYIGPSGRGVSVVQLDDRYLRSFNDDGLREVEDNTIEVIGGLK